MKGEDLKRRISGAKETVKITRAMQLVAASKMNKAEKKLLCGGAFFSAMENIVKKTGRTDSPLAREREVKRTACVAVAGDKGLCGDYNHRILDYARDIAETLPNPVVIAVGRSTSDFFLKTGADTDDRFIHLMQGALSEEIRYAAYSLSEEFLNGTYDEIHMVYTAVEGKNAAGQMPRAVRLFPVNIPEQYSEDGCLEYRNDIDGILKQYVWAFMNFAVRSAEYAFYYKSLVAMTNATTNGEELAEELSAKYNRLRQEKITNELMDAFMSGNPQNFGR